MTEDSDPQSVERHEDSTESSQTYLKIPIPDNIDNEIARDLVTEALDKKRDERDDAALGHPEGVERASVYTQARFLGRSKNTIVILNEESGGEAE